MIASSARPRPPHQPTGPSGLCLRGFPPFRARGILKATQIKPRFCGASLYAPCADFSSARGSRHTGSPIVRSSQTFDALPSRGTFELIYTANAGQPVPAAPTLPPPATSGQKLSSEYYWSGVDPSHLAASGTLILQSAFFQPVLRTAKLIVRHRWAQ